MQQPLEGGALGPQTLALKLGSATSQSCGLGHVTSFLLGETQPTGLEGL